MSLSSLFESCSIISIRSQLVEIVNICSILTADPEILVWNHNHSLVSDAQN
jgi:hypothetical protein